jgi:hypothetical protein
MLKKSVKIIDNGEFTTIKYSFWDVDIPNYWLEKNSHLKSFLFENKTIKNIDVLNEEEKNILILLQEQGCIEEPQKKQYTGHEVYTLFERVVTRWYEIYYNHPIWNKLLEGCSTNTLVAWLIQNYHISRSAGVTDARCATFFPISNLRELFKQNAIEEFWHCDAFYFVNHEKLKISKQSVKDYLPLSSSIAFDQQMLYLAEKDPLAYIMVCYFQESSVRFYSDCKEFYSNMELKYNLNDFFKPWEKHLSFDFEYQHSDRYAEMFSNFEMIKTEDLLSSFKNAAMTTGYLLQAFDEILMEEESQSIILRDPPSKNQNSGIFKNFKKDHFFNLDLRKNNTDFIKEIIDNSSINTSEKMIPHSIENIEYIKHEISNITFRCMGFSYNHDEIQCLGNIARELFESKTSINKMTPINEGEWIALRNFLSELSHKPNSFLPILVILNSIFQTSIKKNLISKKISDKIFNFLENSPIKPIDYIDSCVFLFEKSKKFLTNHNQFYKFDLFKD